MSGFAVSRGPCRLEFAAVPPAFENLFLFKESGPLARFFFYRGQMTETGGTYHERIAAAIEALIEPVVSDLGYELVEVQFRREQHGQVLRIIIFRPEGIGVEDCARVSREVSPLLEVEDLIEQAYHLEVSSPGLDRPLVTPRDFRRYMGNRVQVRLIDGGEEMTGLIADCTDTQVILETEGGKREIPLSRLKKAKLVIEI